MKVPRLFARGAFPGFIRGRMILKIQTKLFLVNLGVMIVLLSILTYVVYERSADMVFDRITESERATLLQISQNLDRKLASYEKVSNYLYLNMTLQENLLVKYPEPILAYDVYFDQFKPFVSMMKTTQDVHQLTLYTPNPSFVFSDIVYLDQSIKQTDWYQQLNNSTSGSYWSSFDKQGVNSVETFARLQQKLNYYDGNTSLFAAIDIHMDELYNLVNEESKGKQIIVTWADESVFLDTHRDDDNKAPLLNEYGFHEQFPGKVAGYYQYENDEGNNLILYNTLSSRHIIDGMKVFMIIPMDDILPEMRQTGNLLLVLLLISCLVSAVCIYIVTFGMMRKLSELSYKMINLHKGNFQSFIEVKGKDEISQLGRIFNRMVRELKRLIQEVYLGEIDRKGLEIRTMEAELYALQTQINPHFFFNVLNTLHGNLLERRDLANAEMVSLIAKAFRIILKKTEMKVTLKEESELVIIYLQIQKYRFEERLDFILDIPLELEGFEVPKMSLQPLVENVVAHVLEKRGKSTRIEIRARVTHSNILISVMDNGTGIDKERLAEIYKWLKSDRLLTPNEHLGLQNVHFRLKSMYGIHSGLQIESGPTGTKVTMVIPMEIKGDG